MYRTKQLLLAMSDLICLYLGLSLAIIIRNWSWSLTALHSLLVPLSGLFFLAIVILFIAGLYDLGNCKNTWLFYQKILISSLIWLIVGIIYFYINAKQFITPKTILLLTTILGFGFISILRTASNRFLFKNWLETILIVGLNPATHELIEQIHTTDQLGYKISAIINTTTDNKFTDLPYPIFSSLESYETSLQQNKFPDIIIISPDFRNSTSFWNKLYQQFIFRTRVIHLADFYEKITGRIPPFTFSEDWFLTKFSEQRSKMYDRFQIIIDYIAGCFIALIWFITFPIIAILIKLTSRGSIFFSQTRIGKMGKNFTIIKYRTMQSIGSMGSAELNGPEFAKIDDKRITYIGRFLRRTRLDELPQFMNILQGDMSIIGPRPERPEFVSELTNLMPFYTLRHLVKPGLTGWAQLHHGYYGNLEENLRKLEYDLYYIKNRTAILDGIILLRTINVILRMAGR